MKHEILVGDVLAGLRAMPDGSVQCVVTSPPYWGLRNYGVEGQIGLEPTPEAYVEKMVEVFREVRRVLRDDGTLWLNLGDCFTSGGRTSNGTREGYMQQTNRGASGECDAPRLSMPPGLKPKDLVGIPWRVAFALQADGWYLRSDVIWCLSGGTWLYVKSQKGVMPMTVKDLARLDPSTVQLWNGAKWTNVKGMYKAEGHESPIEIVLRSGERIGCTPGHVWPTARGNIRADDLRAGDVIDSCTLPDQAEAIPHLPPDMIGYFVGTYLADGSRGKGGDVIQIASHSCEDVRFDILSDIAAMYHGTCRMHKTSENGATINIYSKVLAGVIDTYIAGTSAKTKHLKTAAWQRGNLFLRNVLWGYLRGDGHYDAVNRRWRIGFTRNYALERDLRTLCARLGYSLTLTPSAATIGDREFPAFKGEIRMVTSDHHNVKPRTEIVAVRRSRARQFWDIEVEDEPHLFALASGVLTHNSKPNPMPESVTDRPTKSHEYVFLLAKRERYFYDTDSIREPPTGRTDPMRFWKKGMDGQAKGNRNGAERVMQKDGSIGRNRRTVWEIATQPTPEAHFATFPEALVEPCIKAGTSERGCCPECGAPWRRSTSSQSSGSGDHRAVPGQNKPFTIPRGDYLRSTTGWAPSCTCRCEETVPCVVLDPFGGSGTVAKVARDLGRSSVMIELNPAYVGIMKKRLRVGEQLDTGVCEYAVRDVEA
jgi:DNA modification methylase